MGITLPRRYGGLNFPVTVSVMVVEMVSRADPALMNVFGLQDIAETVNKFATDETQSTPTCRASPAARSPARWRSPSPRPAATCRACSSRRPRTTTALAA